MFMLRDNARMPFMRIAKALGVSEAAVRKKVKKLEKSGAIRKYTIDVDPKKIGFEVDVLIGLDTKPEHLITALEELKEMREVVSLYTSSGDHMILIECWLKSSKDLVEFVRKLRSIEGVTKVCPAIIFDKIK